MEMLEKVKLFSRILGILVGITAFCLCSHWFGLKLSFVIFLFLIANNMIQNSDSTTQKEVDETIDFLKKED